MKNQAMRLEKRPQVQETVDRSSKQVEHAKEIQVSSDGTIPINKIKEFIMWTIKDKYEVADICKTIHCKNW